MAHAPSFLTPLLRFVLPSRLRTYSTGLESLRIERVIAVARLCLSTITLVAIAFDPIVPSGYEPVARALLIFFVAHSVAALIVLRTRQKTTRAFVLTTHTIDILAAAVTLPMASPTNPFFAFFLFVLAAAAFRWGLWEAVATTAASLTLLLLHARLASYLPVAGLGGHYELDSLIIRVAYLAMVGVLLGYLAEESRLLRAEAGVIASLLGSIRPGMGVVRAMRAVAVRVVDLFVASRLLVVLEDLQNHRLFLWNTRGGWSVAPIVAMEPGGIDRSSYFFGPSGGHLTLMRREWPWSAKPTYIAEALDGVGWRAEQSRLPLPASFTTAHPFTRAIAASVQLGEDWSARVFVFDPTIDVRLRGLAQFLHTLAQQVGPALFNVYLEGRLRSRAGAVERARVARELHDGVIQSLIGVEMQLHVLGGLEPIRTTPIAAEMARLQQVVRNEVVSLRELMQQMRPPELDPDELLDYLADMVQRWGRDTGITAHFSTDLREVTLPRHVCFELVRIVQEGLVNVRKHSAAGQVIVRFGVQNGFWALQIDDDGRGFPFEGRLGPADLENRRGGPVIIKERVRAIGGQLAIESRPGRGSRIEVLVPQEARG